MKKTLVLSAAILAFGAISMLAFAGEGKGNEKKECKKSCMKACTKTEEKSATLAPSTTVSDKKECAKGTKSCCSHKEKATTK